VPQTLSLNYIKMLSAVQNNNVPNVYQDIAHPTSHTISSAKVLVYQAERVLTFTSDKILVPHLRLKE
jgi:hypothetical protein